jgi:hypothetical protein
MVHRLESLAAALRDVTGGKAAWQHESYGAEQGCVAVVLVVSAVGSSQS